jgi:hypothetical protein
MNATKFSTSHRTRGSIWREGDYASVISKIKKEEKKEEEASNERVGLLYFSHPDPLVGVFAARSESCRHSANQTAVVSDHGILQPHE